MATRRATGLPVAALALALSAVAGCASDDSMMTPKSLRMTYGGDQAMYERIRSITDCGELADVLAGRSPIFVRRGDRTDLGVDRAARQQLRASGCEVPAS